MSKRRHNFGTKHFKEKSLFIFHARIALKSLILLFVRLIARGARIGKTHTHTHTHRQTDRQTDRTSTVTLAHVRRGLIREKITKPIRDNALPYTVIADETTDAFLNQEILTLCLRFVDLLLAPNPQIRECLLTFIHLQRANAVGISKKILEALTDP